MGYPVPFSFISTFCRNLAIPFSSEIEFILSEKWLLEILNTCSPNKNKVTIIRNVKVIKSLESKEIILWEGSQMFFSLADISPCSVSFHSMGAAHWCDSTAFQFAP